MPAVRGDGMRGLAVFISDIRNCKSKEAEIKRINKELANIRSKFKGDKTLDGYQKKKYVCKLLFIFLLGHDIDFGHMEAVNLLSSNKYSEKQIGYLFISVLVNTNSELIKLIIQSIKNDLASRNPIHVNLALQCIANIGSREMAEAFGNDIPKLLVSGDTMDVVKQSAALCLLRLFRTSQEIIPGGEWTSRIIHLLNDQHMGVVTAATSLIDALVKKNPEEYKGCVSLAVSRLSRIVTASYTDLQDYTYYFVPAPWLSVKLLRLLQNYTPPAEDPDGWLIFSEANLLVRACNQLGQFLSNRETNLRYLALESMCHLATSEFSHEAVKKHQEVVILSMKMEKDVSVRQQAVDLLYAMCDKSNAEEIVQEMLNYLETADYSIRGGDGIKSRYSCEKYATDYTWYVDVILNLIRIAGDYVSEEVWYRVIQIVINRDEVQGYAAKTVFEALQAPACHENMVKVGGYILGEFGNLIAGDQRSSPAVQFQLLHSKYHLCSPMTRALLLSTYIKFINLFPEIRTQVQDVFKQDSNLRSADAELQQRASEYLQLSIIASSDVLATVLEEMPAFPERESSILAVLKKKKPGRVPENDIKENKSPTPVTNHNNEVNNTSIGSADLLGLSTPPTSHPNSGNTGVLLDVLGDIYNKPNDSTNNTWFVDPKKSTLLWSDEQAIKLSVQMKPVEPVLEAGAQIQQMINAECVDDYTDCPSIVVSFHFTNGPQKITIKLPLTINKFFEPTEMNGESFFARWKNLGSTNQQRSQKIFKASTPMDLQAARTKIMGFGMQLLDGIDPNPDNFVCAGIIHMRTQQVGCLLRLEPNKNAQVSPSYVIFGVFRMMRELKMYRLTVRSSKESVSAELCDLLSEQF
ncbi:hypothetical protein NQ317_009998 [Molorchus minor]|uniref:AP-2 complex subunit alpha n=1 Tax=Molorchus minor TaxID=1323400 RepID=A0ABQ9K9H2_9CUCU|nr:hypothetical protein NQ317_009998 [Molorchus minor]